MIDIVIAARDEERDIGLCLASLPQANVWVAVDGRSQDRTAQIARESGATVVTGTRGAAAGRNRAWQLGSGEFVAFLDAHCTVHDGWLDYLVKKMRDTGAGAAQGRIDYRFTGAPTPESSRQSAWAWLKSGNCLYRREILERVGGFDETLLACEDVDLSWRVLLAGYPLAFTEKAVVTHLDRGSTREHLGRSFWQGLGAGQLARRFDLSLPHFLGWGANARQWAYWLGSRLGPRARPYVRPTPVQRWVSWHAGVSLRPRTGVLWWHTETEAILVDAQRRVGLAGGGELFWRCLHRGWTRERILKALPRAEADLDPWVQTMLAEGWLDYSGE